jgi:hypothetical protein
MVLPLTPLPIEEIQNAIEAFRALELRSVSIEELKQMFKPIFHGYTKRLGHLRAGTIVFRGRECKLKPNNISDLRESPKQIARMSRANRENNPFFYCCTTYDAPFFELDVRPGDTIVLSRWITTESLALNNIGFTKNAFLQLRANRDTPSYGEIEMQVPKSNSVVDDFVNGEFIKKVPRGKENEYLYKPTLAIAEMMFSDEMFEALLYPSIAKNGNADNFAIKPRCLNQNKLKLEGVEYVHIDSVDGDDIIVTQLDLADSFQNDGTIEWKVRSNKAVFS